MTEISLKSPNLTLQILRLLLENTFQGGPYMSAQRKKRSKKTGLPPGTMVHIGEIKSDVIFLRKSIWPLRDVIGSLDRRESPLITDAVTLYLRDL